MNQILCIALALFVGLLSSRLMKLLRLPNVTGYLIAGIIFGPFVLGKFIGRWSSTDSETSLNAIKWISEIALGFIAFTIGCSFKRDALARVGKRVIIITICEALGGAIITIGGLFVAYAFLKDQLPISIILTLGAIACATAPAATLMVIRQYKARGPVVDTLIPVVAFDDAVALIAFAVLFSLSKSLAGGTSVSVMEVLVVPLLEIIISVGLGAVLGLLVSLGCKFFKSRANRSIMIICAVLVVVGLSMLAVSKQWKMFGVDFTFSSLLSCMMIGAMFINFRSDASRVIERIDAMTPPLYMLFFVISGASLDITIFASKDALVVVIVALVYIVMRCVGKWTGSYVSSKTTHAEPAVQKYLGFTLFPQAGVAIGLATTANQTFANLGYQKEASLILAVILTATIVYELIGPVITKIALSKAGEIQKEKAA
ncbi:MAG: cation:proton antiporter [Firmicutes bacterium]|nr:cation:proton antiporter [Candidatus Fiminaster equi]